MKTTRNVAGIAVLFWGLICPVAGIAQPVPAFEVASVKPQEKLLIVPGRSGPVQVGFQIDSAHGLFQCSYCSLRSMIGMAWNVIQEDRIIGPDWIGTQDFAIEARMPPGTPTDRAQLMLQTLLKDRFGLVLKNEQRRFPVYSLVVLPGRSKLTKTEAHAVSQRVGSYEIVAPAMSMDSLARILGKRVGRQVLNATGLNGNYEMKLTWTPEEGDDPTVTLFRALREQLGLELKAGNADLDVLIVDQASKAPTAN